MAKKKTPDVSMYTRKDSGKLVVRKKGGPSKKRIKEDPKFDNTRRLNREFGGRSTATRFIRQVLKPLLPVADHNIASTLNVLLKPVQELDAGSDYGERNIELSKAPHLLEGYAINRRTPFEAIVHKKVLYTLSKDTLQATVHLPEIQPGPLFAPPGNFSFYRFGLVLGIVPDLFFNDQAYAPGPGFNYLVPEIFQTDWFSLQAGSPGMTVNLQLADQLSGTPFSLLLAIGIYFGQMRNNEVQVIKYVGGGKILAVH